MKSVPSRIENEGIMNVLVYSGKGGARVKVIFYMIFYNREVKLG